MSFISAIKNRFKRPEPQNEEDRSVIRPIMQGLCVAQLAKPYDQKTYIVLTELPSPALLWTFIERLNTKIVPLGNPKREVKDIEYIPLFAEDAYTNAPFEQVFSNEDTSNMFLRHVETVVAKAERGEMPRLDQLWAAYENKLDMAIGGIVINDDTPQEYSPRAIERLGHAQRDSIKSLLSPKVDTDLCVVPHIPIISSYISNIDAIAEMADAGMNENMFYILGKLDDNKDVYPLPRYVLPIALRIAPRREFNIAEESQRLHDLFSSITLNESETVAVLAATGLAEKGFSLAKGYAQDMHTIFVETMSLMLTSFVQRLFGNVVLVDV